MIALVPAVLTRNCKLVVLVSSAISGSSLLRLFVSVAAVVFDHVTKAWLTAATAVIGTSICVAVCATSPRCTRTPEDHSTTYQRIVIGPGVASSVTLSNSSDVADARRPRTAVPTGRLLSWLEAKKRADCDIVAGGT